MPLALQAKGLTVEARMGALLVPVIRALSFELEGGKVLGLVGESGAGKSMVGRAIAQLLPPGFMTTSGSLAFEGQDLARMPAVKRRALLGRAIAFIPQAPLTALNPVRSIGAQLDEHLARVSRGNAAERRQHAITLLEAAQLPQADALLRRYPHQLSGGMCQRVLIAMAFSSNPRLVIADEPTTALDVTMHAPIIRLIADMQRRHNTAVIFITHDLRLAAQICDDIVVMYAGRAVESGPARGVLANPAHPYTRCLQLANPSIRADRRALYVMPEQMPSLQRLATMLGCHFAPRCPLVTSECRRAEPPEAALSPGRRTACFRATATAAIVSAEQLMATIRQSSRRVLIVEGLQKTYAVSPSLGRTRSVLAVKDTFFSIAENEFVALVGESGSGKSTIAKLLVGLERPDAGRIVLNGTDVIPASRSTHKLRAEGLQMVFQDSYSALNPRRRVASIVTQAMEAGTRHATWDERLKRTKELLAEVGMPADLAARLPGQLSGGQRQRINIARALCRLPKVLIADEIVSGLDLSIQAQLLNLLTRLRVELDFAMLFISHDLSVVRHLCSRVLVMYRGELVEQGPVESVFANPQHPHTRMLISSVPPDEPGAVWPMLQTN